MRHATVRSAVLAATLAMAVACTADHGMTIGPPHSTAPSAGGAGTSGTGSTGTDPTGTDPAGTDPAGTDPAGTEAAGTGATANGGQRPASIGPGADIPASVMLQPGDWPDGRVRAEQTGVAALPQPEPSACQPHTAFPSDRHRYGARTRHISSDQPESGGVEEVAVRYSTGRAAQAMAEMRRVLAACHSYRDADFPGGAAVSYRLERQGFAGDDSLLVLRSHQPTTGRAATEYISVVRIRDALLTTSSNGGEATASLGLALRLATAGARRGACLRSSC